ncbi:Glutathione transferase [Aspergillus sclerotialis]|uniref:Glutathione transferase n=1 Tax=Aspergillus sclerotialis TaxID=2070753 RepID=A0A3A3A0Q8_9EURO|nr:Glutathione transferase [Aspergillus sclerotialis]
MENSNPQSLPIDPHHLQQAFLPSLAEDTSNLVSDHSHQFQSPHHSDAIHQLHTSNFLRPPRPGEQANTLLSHSHPPRRHTGGIVRSSNRNAGEHIQLGLTPSSHVDMNLDTSVASRLLSTGTRDDTSEVQSNDFAALQFPDQSLHQDTLTHPTSTTAPGNTGRSLNGLKLIPKPPDLEAWREKLFNVDKAITLTEEQFNTYFPHVDNVYSHRSTQHYKRKSFVSHYWDCRLKGRPPGTPKSNDPLKKKRKRTARQRDLCDVKIKIIEYFAGPVSESAGSAVTSNFPSELLAGGENMELSTDALVTETGTGTGARPFGVLVPNPALSDAGHQGGSGGKYFTIQRVNGNGANGKNDGIGSGGHKHTLEESDRVKKNSVQRFLLKEAQERKKAGITLGCKKI